MADTQSFAGYSDSPAAAAASSATLGDQQPDAPYPPAALARLRAALRAGLVPAAPAPAIHDDPSAEQTDQPARLAIVADALPEHTDYHDEGCHIAPACLRCPLERCIFDRSRHADAAVRRGRNRRMRTLARRGWPIERLAGQFRLSPAHVRRILRAQRSERSQHRCDAEPPPAPDA